MVVNSCFEDLEGRVGLKRVWEFVPEVEKKEEWNSEGEQSFLILVVLPEGSCWWTLSVLWCFLQMRLGGVCQIYPYVPCLCAPQ